MTVNDLATELRSALIPDIKELLDSFQSFENFFKNLKKIILIDDCDIYSETMPNEATDDKLYHNQKILQFVYKNKTINFDLIDRTILSDDFQILLDTANITSILADSEDGEEEIYSKDELLEQFTYSVDLNSKLKTLQYTFQHLSEDDFKELLESTYKIEFIGTTPYIRNGNCKHFICASLIDKKVELTGEVSFLKNGEWKDSIMLEKKLNTSFKTEEEYGN